MNHMDNNTDNAIENGAGAREVGFVVSITPTTRLEIEREWLLWGRDMLDLGHNDAAMFAGALVESYDGEGDLLTASVAPAIARHLLSLLGLDGRRFGCLRQWNMQDEVVVINGPDCQAVTYRRGYIEMLASIPNTGEWLSELLPWVRLAPLRTLEWIRIAGIPSHAERTSRSIAEAMSDRGRGSRDLRAAVLEIIGLFGQRDCGKRIETTQVPTFAMAGSLPRRSRYQNRT